MENKPKRSKALIITIIILIFVVISVYLIIKNRDSFGTKTSNTITKIFSPLLPSLNSKNLSVLVDYPFLGSDNKCTNKATNPPLCTIDTNSKCLNGNTNPPLCTLNTNNKCANGAVNSPLCTIGSNNKCLNGTTNPPLCTLSTNNKCANGAVNSPLCTIGSNNKCLNGTTNPPLCTISSDDQCFNGATNPPACTIGGDDQCFNGATNPPLCTIGGDDQCFNGATNPPACTIDDDTNVNSYECSDDKDNDGDNKIDNLDPNCHIDGNLEKDYVSTHNSESESPYSTIPTPTIDPYNKWTQCSDRKDNDADEKIDELDPNCHIGGDLEKDYVSTHDSESESPKSDEPTVIEEENKCKLFEENPLLFTPEEKAKLAQLLRKYYIISSTLKTEVDISMIYADIDRFNIEIEEINDLTRQCYLYTNDITGYNNFKTRNPKLKLQDFALNTSPSPNYNYTGPKTKNGNPWFKPEARASYLDPKLLSGEKIISELPKCTGTININKDNGWFLNLIDFVPIVGDVVRSYRNYDTGYLNGKDCGAKENPNDLNAESRFTCEYITGEKGEGKLYSTGCEWEGLSGVKDWQGINDDYENLLNVW